MPATTASQTLNFMADKDGGSLAAMQRSDQNEAGIAPHP
jgi:hypothetical protein